MARAASTLTNVLAPQLSEEIAFSGAWTRPASTRHTSEITARICDNFAAQREWAFPRGDGGDRAVRQRQRETVWSVAMKVAIRVRRTDGWGRPWLWRLREEGDSSVRANENKDLNEKE